MSIRKDIDELVKENVISNEIASSIDAYYQRKSISGNNRLVAVFAVLGALLIGLGIILIIAHNWDNFSRSSKSILAFIPMTVGQALVLYAIFKKKDSSVWKESSSAFLILSIGACIALISQIYHIDGALDTFMITWCLLGLPLVYIARSSISSLLYIVGCTIYAFSNPAFQHGGGGIAFPYFLLLAGVLPYYWKLLNQKPGILTYYHHWFFVISISISLGPVLAFDYDLSLSYIALFGMLYQIGLGNYFRRTPSRVNAYKVIGSLGTLIVLFVLSSRYSWSDFISRDNLELQQFLLPLIFSLLGIGFFLKEGARVKVFLEKPVSLVFLIYPLLYFTLKQAADTGSLIVNIIILAIAVNTVYQGSKLNRLGLLNWGLSIIAFQMFLRFVDTDWSFVVKGIVFVLVGAGFFLGNFILIKKKRSNEI